MKTENAIPEDAEAAIGALAVELGSKLESARLYMTTAESCTGGLVAAAITEVAGSSGWFERGVVTYSNEAKQALLGVDPSIFAQHGAVSEACVRAMANGALQCTGADVALSVSGIAGPGGATPGKPVGTVWIGWAIRCLATSEKHGDTSTNLDVSTDARVFTFSGDRRFVRQQAVYQGLRGTILRVDNAGLLK
ncbi:MAG: CinA family protein [Granulosicoccus sp.]